MAFVSVVDSMGNILYHVFDVQQIIRSHNYLPEDTNLSTRNTWIRYEETQLHWRGWANVWSLEKWLRPKVLLAGNWGRRYWQPHHLPDHEYPLGIERQRHSCTLLLGARPLWHRREWDNGPASTEDPWPWHRPSNDCRFEATGKLLHLTGSPN